jgi:hypothetical protein
LAAEFSVATKAVVGVGMGMGVVTVVVTVLITTVAGVMDLKPTAARLGVLLTGDSAPSAVTRTVAGYCAAPVMVCQIASRQLLAKQNALRDLQTVSS